MIREFVAILLGSGGDIPMALVADGFCGATAVVDAACAAIAAGLPVSALRDGALERFGLINRPKEKYP
ncbi:MAG: hypothetical protein P4M07_01720 [Xanthobacteraceae bacterium]|nr:hypothetical protein [Xanthobacteraceae bacterium]